MERSHAAKPLGPAARQHFGCSAISHQPTEGAPTSPHVFSNVMPASVPMSGETSACLQLSFRYRVQYEAGQGICMIGPHPDVSTSSCMQNCPSPTQFGLQPEVLEAEHSACASHRQVRKLGCSA